jgi:thioredoxin
MRKITLLMVALMTAISAYSADPVKVLTDATMLTDVYNYKTGKTVTKRPAIVDLWAPWCGPCRRLAPTLDSLAVEYAGRVDFYKVNVDDNPAITQAFRVESIPMLLFIPNDGTKPRYLLGLQPASNLRGNINKILLKQ